MTAEAFTPSTFRKYGLKPHPYQCWWRRWHHHHHHHWRKRICFYVMVRRCEWVMAIQWPAGTDCLTSCMCMIKRDTCTTPGFTSFLSQRVTEGSELWGNLQHGRLFLKMALVKTGRGNSGFNEETTAWDPVWMYLLITSRSLNTFPFLTITSPRRCLPRG